MCACVCVCVCVCVYIYIYNVNVYIHTYGDALTSILVLNVCVAWFVYESELWLV
jgi:hypothetical protein